MKRVVLITGASSGIGEACATHLHRLGYRVYGTSRQVAETKSDHSEFVSVSPSGDAAPAALNGGTAGSFEMIHMDVDNDDSVQLGVARIFEREQRLDAVVNNAGFGFAGAIENTSIEEAQSQFDTNFFGVLRVCRAALPIMREQGAGHIVNIGSMAGRVGVPYQGLYCASKFALEGLSEALRLEVRSFGIKVVLIAPGDFYTSFTARRRRTGQSQEDTAYRERFNTALRIMEASELGGSDPIRIARLLEKVLENPSPRLRYTVGPLFQRVAIALKQVVPSQLFQWGLAKYLRLG
jgi:NAD(P)-dependent dehydrogenase (short-subunit alcohol dehydrogenase family)